MDHTAKPAAALEHLRFPGEDARYRAARNALLDEEIALRQHVEQVAAQRRALPPGGLVPEDFVFEGLGPHGAPTRMPMSSLFGPDDRSLVLYSFMYGPEREKPCPNCTHFLDSLDGAARHAAQRINLFIVAKSPLARLLALARDRHWHHLVFLGTADNRYDEHYFGDSQALSPAMRRQQNFKDGKESDMPMLNVFTKDGDRIRHRWGSEMLYMPPDPGQDYRHNDLIDPIWNLLDVTPEGRGNFQTRLAY